MPKRRPPGARGRGELTDDVAVRTHGGRVPRIDGRGVHGKAVIVLADGDDVTRAGLREEVDP
jgi:hypothetical protein